MCYFGTQYLYYTQSYKYFALSNSSRFARGFCVLILRSVLYLILFILYNGWIQIEPNKPMLIDRSRNQNAWARLASLICNMIFYVSIGNLLYIYCKQVIHTKYFIEFKVINKSYPEMYVPLKINETKWQIIIYI